MWENEEHKNLVRNIIIFAVLVVVAAALLITMFAVKKRINAEDELLKAESDSQRQELNNVRKDSLDSVQVAYDAYLAALQEYLPGIVCWGDSLTAVDLLRQCFLSRHPAKVHQYLYVRHLRPGLYPGQCGGLLPGGLEPVYRLYPCGEHGLRQGDQRDHPGPQRRGALCAVRGHGGSRRIRRAWPSSSAQRTTRRSSP